VAELLQLHCSHSPQLAPANALRRDPCLQMREKLTDYKAENELLGRMITDLKVRAH
jgi:hypothetical protein